MGPRDSYEERMKGRRRSSLLENLRTAALGGAASGALLGGAGKVIGGARKLADIAKGAGIGGAISGGLAAGATGLGSALMGSPSEDDSHGFTHRGAVGGAVGGLLLGGGLGGLASSGHLTARSLGIKPNLLTDYFAALAKNPTKFNVLKGALLGAGGGALIAGHHGGEEGMQLDFINHELEDEDQRRRRRFELGDDT